MQYSPDYWMVVKISGLGIEKPLYKVFATWVGGYCRGDEWRMNSGITSVEEKENLLAFYGASGSCYVCHNDEHVYRGSAYSDGILGDYVKKLKEREVTMEVLPFDTNWKELNYEY